MKSVNFIKESYCKDKSSEQSSIIYYPFTITVIQLFIINSFVFLFKSFYSI